MSQTCCDGSISPFPGAGVRFSLRGTTYQNNSLVTLEDLGEGDDALLCVTDQPACCGPLYNGEMGPAIGNWYFPNGTRVPSETEVTSGLLLDFFRTRGHAESCTYAPQERWSDWNLPL